MRWVGRSCVSQTLLHGGALWGEGQAQKREPDTWGRQDSGTGFLTSARTLIPHVGPQKRTDLLALETTT